MMHKYHHLPPSGGCAGCPHDPPTWGDFLKFAALTLVGVYALLYALAKWL
jgi:hypothetical protein